MFPTGYFPAGYIPNGYFLVPQDVPDPADDPPPGWSGGSAGTLPLPASPQAVAYAKFVELVTLDPALSGMVAFRSWRGEEGDSEDPASLDETPWVRFSPIAGKRERWATEGVWHSPILVHVDQITPGYAVSDSFNLFHAINSLVESSAFQGGMAEAGASGVWFDEGGYGEKANLPKFEPKLDGGLTSLGVITIDLYLVYEG